MKYDMNRRQWIKTTAAGVAASAFAMQFGRAFGAEEDRPYKIGICDWSIGQRGKINSFKVASDWGYEGVQISFEPVGDINLRLPETQKEFLAASKEYNCGISSLAMGVLNSRPLATDPDAESWVSDCIEIQAAMKVPAVLLAFFGKGNLKNMDAEQKSVIEKLKRLAPKAEKLGVNLAIESTLNAEEHLKIIDAVGSKNVTIYYDVANMTNNGYDIFKELTLLCGKGLISEIHMKETGGKRLGEGKIDFPKVRKCLDDIGYRGWVVAESATRGDLEESQRQNAKFLKEVFGS